ncbi:MAG: hypothetical protein AB7G88_15640 [Thermomicrobiales bacterium]
MLDAYRDLIDELLETPTAIRDALANHQKEASADQIAMQIALIRDHDLRTLELARTIMQRQDALIDDSVPLVTESGQALEQVLGEMDVARGDLVSLLINLSLKDWERTAILKSGGEITIGDMIEDHVEFDEAARARLRDIVRAE